MTHNTSQNPTTEPASRNNNAQGAKVYGLTTVAKHPPEQSTTAAKHPPDQNGGKASANEDKPTTKRPTTKHDPDDADEMKQRQAQKQKLSEESQ